MTPRPQERSVRIIGGKWRGRKISFADRTQVRPTPSRVRETLFNWLQAEIAGSRTLEPFGGSGVLSLEALSRGARDAHIVERDRPTAAAIEANRERLGADNLFLHVADALTWTAARSERWDIVFLDPPFAGNRYRDAINLAASHVAHGGFVYVESGDPLDPAELPNGFNLLRQKRAARVHFALLQFE